MINTIRVGSGYRGINLSLNALSSLIMRNGKGIAFSKEQRTLIQPRMFLNGYRNYFFLLLVKLRVDIRGSQ